MNNDIKIDDRRVGMEGEKCIGGQGGNNKETAGYTSNDKEKVLKEKRFIGDAVRFPFQNNSNINNNSRVGRNVVDVNVNENGNKKSKVSFRAKVGKLIERNHGNRINGKEMERKSETRQQRVSQGLGFHEIYSSHERSNLMADTSYDISDNYRSQALMRNDKKHKIETGSNTSALYRESLNRIMKKQIEKRSEDIYRMDSSVRDMSRRFRPVNSKRTSSESIRNSTSQNESPEFLYPGLSNLYSVNPGKVKKETKPKIKANEPRNQNINTSHTMDGLYDDLSKSRMVVTHRNYEKDRLKDLSGLASLSQSKYSKILLS